MKLTPTYQCTACGQECQVVTRDFGIGNYEYWGASGVDTNLRAVSNCCENIVADDNNNEVTIFNINSVHSVNTK